MLELRGRSLAAALILCVGGGANAAETGEAPYAYQIEEVTIIGTADAARSLAGTGSVVTHDQVRIEFANDINQLLKTVPGVYIREEDGYGLRPNIGIRGATSERASKITLLEDGVMIAPAPYSNPAAYYFPTALRMYSTEVLKGAPLLRHGPQTTGGIVNMISTPIPREFGGQLNLRYGENGEQDLLANVGGKFGDFGVLLETAQRRGDGFKDIDGADADAGFDIRDYVFKVAWQRGRHSLLLKTQYSEEVSDETYLGLTDSDFAEDPSRRYNLTRIDRMDNDHLGLSLNYGFELSDQVRLGVIAYHNEFNRDWFKVDNASGLLAAADAGDDFAARVLAGSADFAGLEYKHNNRSYESEGVEINADINAGAHTLAVGARVHRDSMDRFQPVELFDQVGGELVFDRIIEPTGSNNRFEEADAIALWAVDRWRVTSALALNLALRYEDVESRRRQYSDVARTTEPLLRGNDSREWLPGISFTYDFADEWQLLAGVHRGFSPLGGGATENEEPETSINYEAGLRYGGAWFAEAVAFYSDFDNKSENCSNANPCSNGSTAGSFTTGEAIISGVELQLGGAFALAGFSFPVDLAYTYTDAEISEDNPTSGVLEGDRLAAVPEHAFSLRTGIETTIGWDSYLVVKYIDSLCVTVGCDRAADSLSETEDLLVTDLISRYALREGAVVFVKVDNLFDEQAIVSRQPTGARPNRPRTASVGVQWSF